MREFIVELKQGHTVILSSHLLHEVGQICDDITIINEEDSDFGTVQEIMSRFKTANMIEVELGHYDEEKIFSFSNRCRFI